MNSGRWKNPSESWKNPFESTTLAQPFGAPCFDDYIGYYGTPSGGKLRVKTRSNVSAKNQKLRTMRKESKRRNRR